MQYLEVGLFPVNAPHCLSVVWTGKIQPEHWQRVLFQYKKGKSLRKLAKAYGVSYEAVRRIKKAAKRAEVI